jgi:N-acetylglucosamine-6-sulfatase
VRPFPRGSSGSGEPRRRMRFAVIAMMAAIVGTVPPLVIAATGQGVGTGSSAPIGSLARPNLVVILTDDQRWDSLWAMPHVEEHLVDHGVSFRQSFVTTSLCCPSRATFLTGQYSRHTGVRSNGPPDGGAPALDDRSTLATWLHDGGYTTAWMGKYLNRYDLLAPGYVPPGWDDWHVLADRDPFRYYGGYELNENGRLVRYGTLPSQYSTSVLTSRALEFMDRARRPFFLVLATAAPHLPAYPLPRDRGRLAGKMPAPPPSFGEVDMSDKPYGARAKPYRAGFVKDVLARRQSMTESLLEVDRSVDLLIRKLDRLGELDRTIFILTSDNGYLLGEHRLLEKGWPYEESIRVPLLVRLPSIRSPGAVDDHLVLNVDLAPTILQLAGVRAGLPQDGVSLLPLLRGDRDTRWRSAFLEEFLGQGWQGGPPNFEAVRTDRYLYAEYVNGWRELYDLETDPYELENLAGRVDQRPLQFRLRLELGRLRTSLDEGFPTSP